MADFSGPREGQSVELGLISVRIGDTANSLGFDRHGSIHTPDRWIWYLSWNRGWLGTMPDVQSGHLPAVGTEVPQLR